MPAGGTRFKVRTLFITGTDTGVGKTVVSVLLTRFLAGQGYRVAAFKPIASGGRGDAAALRAAAHNQIDLDTINPWHYRAAVAPLLAARMEGRRLQLSQVIRHIRRHAQSADMALVEGAGGLLSPLGDGFDSRDVIRVLGAVPVVVCPNRLGAVNQVRLVVEALPPVSRRRAVVVLVNPARPGRSSSSNAALLGECFDSNRILAIPWIQRWCRPGVVEQEDLRNALERMCILLALDRPMSARRN